MGGDTRGAPLGPSTYPKMASDPMVVMKHLPNIYADRLNTFFANGQYEGTNLRSKLIEASAQGEPHVKLSVYSPPDQTRPTFKDATSQKFKPTRVGESFGPSWSTHWFKVQLTVPSSLTDKEHLEFHWNSNSEALVWSEDGMPMQGLTGGGEREEWIFPKSFRDGKEHVFYVEMACNAMFGNATSDTIQPPDPNRYFQVSKADVVAVNLVARALLIDFWILKDAAREFPSDGWQEHDALRIANEVIDCYDVGGGTNECLEQCRKIAAKYVGDKAGSSKVYDEGPNAIVTAIGNCHIDTCWLWPWAETKRKVARSWTNQCNLIEQYPEYNFAASQAQQFRWLKMYYPEVFDRVKTKVKDGSFQPIGGSWVEHDTNMPSGESLVRQFLYGQRFFESHFGERHNTFWLPDTFGYSSQLPQLCRLAGMSRFFTQKLSWNNINTFPHTTFNWVSLDGSQVLCHMAPCETYTAEADFGDVKRSITQHKSMNEDSTSILPYGKGDGGGGPTWQHIEKLRRCRGISNNVGQLPPVKVGQTVDDFFSRLEKKAEHGTEYVSWYGELYLELHRGTYTTQANNKKYNRAAERMLHDIECLATFASISKGSTYTYPKAELDEMWENVLLCQFHDCLPGSSIEMCYRDSDELYKKVFTTGERLLKDASAALKALACPPTPTSALPVLRKSDCHPPKRVSIEQRSDDVWVLGSDYLNVVVTKGLVTSIYDKHARRELVPTGKTANQMVLFDDKPLYWQAWDVEVFHLNSRKVLTPDKVQKTQETSDLVSLTTTTRISDLSTISTTITLRKNTWQIDFAATVDWHETQKFLKVEFPTTILSNTSTASYETQYGIVRRPIHYNTSWDMAKFEVCCHKWADLSDAEYGVSILNDCKYGFAVAGSTMRLSLLRSPKAPDAHADMGTHHFRYAILPHASALGPETVHAAIKFNNPYTAPEYPVHITDDTEMSQMQRQPLFPYTDIYDHPLARASIRNNYQMGFRVLENPATESPFTTAPHFARYRCRTEAFTPAMSSIIVDCIKRGEDDVDVRKAQDKREKVTLPIRKGKSVIVRMYDSIGALSRGFLMFGELNVIKVVECNLLEDDGDEVEVNRPGGLNGGGPRGCAVELRPFEVKSFRLTLAEE